MKRRGFMAACVLVALAACGDLTRDSGSSAAKLPPPPPAPTERVETVRSWPHDTSAFTQGLAYGNGVLYESTGRYGQSSVRRVEPETGRVLQETDLPAELFGEGLALLGDRLFQITWKEGTGFVYDRNTLRSEGTFAYDGEGWGLTTDGRELILSDGTYRLRFLDPNTFQVTRTLDVTDGGGYVYELNELEWVRGEIWANVWQTDRIARIDPESGRVVGWLDLAGLLPAAERTPQTDVLNGIAYDAAGNRLLVTGKLWPRLFQIRVPGFPAGGGETAPDPTP